jgi:hypothetical protein
MCSIISVKWKNKWIIYVCKLLKWHLEDSKYDLIELLASCINITEALDVCMG